MVNSSGVSAKLGHLAKKHGNQIDEHSIGLDHCTQRGCADDVMEPATSSWSEEVKSFRRSEVREMRTKINRRAQ